MRRRRGDRSVRVVGGGPFKAGGILIDNATGAVQDVVDVVSEPSGVRLDLDSPRSPRRGERRNSYARRPRDFQFMGWVKQQRCRLSELDSSHRCNGRAEADHIGDIGERAKGNKCDDTKTIPLCPGAHDQREQRRGYFAGWSTVQMRAWADEQIALYQARYAARDLGGSA